MAKVHAEFLTPDIQIIEIVDRLVVLLKFGRGEVFVRIDDFENRKTFTKNKPGAL